MNIKILNLILICSFWIWFSCGEGTVDVQNESYEPRIVVEGFLVAGQQSVKVLFTRNFKLDTDFSKLNLVLNPEQTNAYITCLNDGKIYDLTFTIVEDQDQADVYWEYQDSDFVVECGQSYQLDVNTIIDGKNLSARAVTTVPPEGFVITQFNYDSLIYRQRNGSGEVMTFEATFNLSLDTHLYLAAIQALNPQSESFIYDNPYEKVEPEDVDLVEDSYHTAVVFNLDQSIGYGKMKLDWYNFSFYDNYRIIFYATDQNYREFAASYDNVMEMDGNFHEAKFNIEGDGIGVFGSMIADTLYCTVLKN